MTPDNVSLSLITCMYIFVTFLEHANNEYSRLGNREIILVIFQLDLHQNTCLVIVTRTVEIVRFLDCEWSVVINTGLSLVEI